MKKYLIIGIVLLICGIGFAIFDEYLKNTHDIHDIINSGSKEEGTYAYLDATYIAGTINSEDENSYFVIYKKIINIFINI